MSERTRDLTSLHAASGVNDKHQGFVTLTAYADDGPVALGQLDPDDARILALHILEVAEAAETDALIMSGLVDRLRGSEELSKPDAESFAARIIGLLRAARAEEHE